MTVERFPIEAGHVMMFARSIGDPNPIYSDAEYAAASEVGTIIAPPTFVQASAQFDDDYPLRPKIGAPWFGSGRTPTLPPREPGASRGSGAVTSGGTGLHAEQHYTYHRPVRVGDVLSVPINHFEGNYTCDERTLAELRAEERVVVRYVDNPNGSLDDIAGICNAAGNVVGLMPHPERASDALLGSSDGVVLLKSLLAAATSRATMLV